MTPIACEFGTMKLLTCSFVMCRSSICRRRVDDRLPHLENEVGHPPNATVREALEGFLVDLGHGRGRPGGVGSYRTQPPRTAFYLWKRHGAMMIPDAVAVNHPGWARRLHPMRIGRPLPPIRSVRPPWRTTYSKTLKPSAPLQTRNSSRAQSPPDRACGLARFCVSRSDEQVAQTHVVRSIDVGVAVDVE